MTRLRGQGVQAGFKVFCQLLVQLQSNFDMKALETLVTLEVVDAIVANVEEKVAAVWEGTRVDRVSAKAKNEVVARDLEEVDVMVVVLESAKD